MRSRNVADSGGGGEGEGGGVGGGGGGEKRRKRELVVMKEKDDNYRVVVRWVVGAGIGSRSGSVEGQTTNDLNNNEQ